MTEDELIKLIKEYFTVDELDVVFKTVTHRIWSLEDCKLEDSYCYPRLFRFREKLRKVLEPESDKLEISKSFFKKC